MTRLDPDVVDEQLAHLAWERRGDVLVKVVRCGNFAGSLAFVNAVGELAEAHNHHPDLAISWDTVTLTLTTHSAGGLTAADLNLAAEIDRLGPSS